MLERYEFKYLIDETQADEIRATALSVGVRDEYAGESGRYTIRSLYFDTPEHHLFFANDREAVDRFKMRVRSYPDAPMSPVFLEIKRRTKDVIRKSRAAIKRDIDWRRAMVADREVFARLSPSQRNAASNFARHLLLYHLEPKILIDYEREAFASTIDNYARLTIDRKIISQPMTKLSLEADPKAWRPIDHRVITNTPTCISVLELKFERRPPRWMVALVRRLELVRYSYSKYGNGIEMQHTLPEARTPTRSPGPPLTEEPDRASVPEIPSPSTP
ncbi:MAG: polyphosphate polymerase domain-containing protein [Polyangiaceae bacterium]